MGAFWIYVETSTIHTLNSRIALLSFTFRPCFLVGSWTLARLFLCCYFLSSELCYTIFLLFTWHTVAS